MQSLVITPSPEEYESIIGYVLRVSESNGYETPGVMLKYTGIKQSEMKSLDFPKEKLATITNKSIELIERIARVTTDTKGKVTYKVINHQLKKFHRVFRVGKSVICPECISETGHIDVFWDLNFSVVCPHHKKPPISHCNHCGLPVSLFRPGLKKCRCGEDIENNQPMLDEQPILEMMQILWAKLHNQKLSRLENKSNFPIDAFENMSLDTFLTIITNLASLENSQVEGSKKYEKLEIVRTTSNILANWPYNFNSFLLRFHKKRIKTFGQNISFHICYMPIFNLLFRGKLPEKEIAFLREEYEYFRLNEWKSPLELNSMEKANHNSEKIFTNKNVGLTDIQSPEQNTNQDAEFLALRKAAQFIGLPVRVLTGLKKSRHFKINNIARHYKGYSKSDLINFKNKLLEKSILKNIDLQENSSLLDLDFILQKIKFHLKNGKAEFVANYLDGKILSVGKTADEIDKIYFNKEDVYEFSEACKKVVNTKQGKMSYPEASELIGTDAGGIMALTDRGLVEKIPNTQFISLCRESVEKFASNYAGITKIAFNNKTSSKRVINLCNSFSIPVLTIPRRGKSTVSFINREDCDQLEIVIKENPRKRVKIRLKKPPSNNYISKLNRYLSELRTKNESLPIVAGRLFKTEIAKMSGFNRNAFYNNTEVSKMLDDYVSEFNKKNNTTHLPAEKLRNYIEHLKTTFSQPPCNASGNLNKHKIAEICGFDRHLIYRNREIIEMFNEIQLLRL